MEEMQRVRCGEREELPRAPLSPNLHVCQPWSPTNAALLGFYGGFIARVWLIKSLSIGNQYELQPLCPLEIRRAGLKVVGTPGKQPHP